MEKDPSHDKGFVDIERSKEIFDKLTQQLSRDNKDNEKRKSSSSDATATEDNGFDLHEFVNVGLV